MTRHNCNQGMKLTPVQGKRILLHEVALRSLVPSLKTVVVLRPSSGQKSLPKDVSNRRRPRRAASALVAS